MYGAFKARAVPVNVNHRYTAHEMAAVLEDIDPVVVVFESDLAEVVAEATSALGGRNVTMVEITDGADTTVPGALPYSSFTAGDDEVELPVRSGDDRYLLFTGGTTGSPKGVIWRQSDIYDAAVHGQRHVPHSTDDELATVADAAQAAPARVLLPLPPFMHGAAQWLAMAALHGGDTVVLPPLSDRLDVDAVWSTVEQWGVQVLLIVADAFGRPLADALRSRPDDAASLRLIVTGGAAMSGRLKREFEELIPGVLIVDVAGSSESGGLLTAAGSGATGPMEFFAGPSACVLDDRRSRTLAPDDPTPGWLASTGAVPTGYLNDPRKTMSTFPTVGEDRMSVPGDRAQWVRTGVIRLLGRDSQTINTGGEKVFAEEVEAALLHHPQVIDVVVVGRPHERWGEEIVAVAQLDADAPDDRVIIDACREHLADFKVPKALVRVGSVRRSAAGKADYAWARSVAAEGVGAAER
jgi:fatty-acyl-CoA synthase